MTETDQLTDFAEVWLFDFEFISRPGEPYDVVCLVAHEMRSGRTIKLWRDQLTDTPPYRTDAGVLFVCFVATAECGCHLALGWPMPAKVLDLSPQFRNITNGVTLPDDPRDKKGKGKKGLIGALRYYGIETVGATYKDAMQKRVMEGWPYTEREREQILTYCESDVTALKRLLPEMLPSIDLPIALYRSEFSGPVSALMEYRGVPIDMEIFGRLRDKRIWASIRDAMVPKIDVQYDVYSDTWREKESDGSVSTAAGSISRTGLSRRWLRHIRRLSPYVSCATSSASCAKSSWQSAPTRAIGPCCGRLWRRHRARSPKLRSGYSRRLCGCARLSSQVPAWRWPTSTTVRWSS